MYNRPEYHGLCILVPRSKYHNFTQTKDVLSIEMSIRKDITEFLWGPGNATVQAHSRAGLRFTLPITSASIFL